MSGLNPIGGLRGMASAVLRRFRLRPHPKGCRYHSLFAITQARNTSAIIAAMTPRGCRWLRDGMVNSQITLSRVRDRYQVVGFLPYLTPTKIHDQVGRATFKFLASDLVPPITLPGNSSRLLPDGGPTGGRDIRLVIWCCLVTARTSAPEIRTHPR
jgi:hypothetical protein